MQSSLFVLWAVVGWCGTPFPGWWWWWRLPHPPPPPDPWYVIKLISVIGGLAGGWAFTNVFKPQPNPWTIVPAAATALGAFLGARLLVDLYGLARGGAKTTGG